ncbi:hypothetical protein BSZ35_00085 [Salinibacter sp. 10B]|uniref:hypothetical protein n=1 Tax=Salinibacter sp. 10B TaxID=1923971 RepID=UPI000CF4045D|nr:hypothetical protein [Salinibacter sp. 10B]PQJ36788.1 hypothetical protein BSZ35_00085 [Salinibacter sp. 10B]
MPDSTIANPILETIRRQGKPSIALGGAAWVVWSSESLSGAGAAMSSAQFVHFNAPVIAVQTGGRMEYFDDEGQLQWTSNLPWPRANLEMARLPGRPDSLRDNLTDEDSSGDSSEANSTES